MQSPLTTDRTKLRMERLKQLELEQMQWEQEALVMPEDLNRALLLSFESVKTEFSDLDGLSWPRYPVPLVTNPWALDEPTPKLTCSEIDDQRPTPRPYPRPDTTPDTVRVSRLTQPSRSPLLPANQFSPHKDPPGSGSPYTLPRPTNLALACHGLRHPAYRHS